MSAISVDPMKYNDFHSLEDFMAEQVIGGKRGRSLVKMTRRGSMRNLRKNITQKNSIESNVAGGLVHCDLTQSNVIHQEGENIVQENSYVV